MTDWLEDHLFVCFFKAHFGVDCPGCGTQRALIALLRGDLSQSLAYHAALIPFMATIIALIIQLKVKHVNGGKVVMWLFILTSAITFIQFIIRQIILFT
jgi:hypothetical protein